LHRRKFAWRSSSQSVRGGAGGVVKATKSIVEDSNPF
jgi:hypothetical protein